MTSSGTAPGGGGEQPAAAHDGGAGIQIAGYILAALQKGAMRALFEGKGRLDIGPDGVPLPPTSENYDRAIVRTLASKGFTDPGELLAVVWNRPDGTAKARGLAYAKGVVRDVLDEPGLSGGGVEPSELHSVGVPAVEDWRVELVDLHEAPELHISLPNHPGTTDRVLRLPALDILNRGKVRIGFFKTFLMFPDLGEKEDWPDLAHKLLRTAPRVDAGAESSEHGQLREILLSYASKAKIAEHVEDLERGRRAMWHEDTKVFHINSLVGAAKDQLPTVTQKKVCSALHTAGFRRRHPELLARDGELKRTRVWAAPSTLEMKISPQTASPVPEG